jgi:hypothetical protein
MLYFIVNYIPMNGIVEDFVVDNDDDDDDDDDDSNDNSGGDGDNDACGSKGLNFVRPIGEIQHTFKFFLSRE